MLQQTHIIEEKSPSSNMPLGRDAVLKEAQLSIAICKSRSDSGIK